MERRRFLLALAAGLAGAAVARGPAAPEPPAPVAAPAPPPPAPARAAPRRPLPPTGVVEGLPGHGNALALTIDDGTSTEVVAAFATFAAESGTRLTFFPNGRYRSWSDNAALLRPLVESGQVALGNHTWSHPDLRTLDDREVADEIGRNRDFLRTVFGVRDSPFFRPPFGFRDERIDRIAADQGHPTVVLWDGTLADSRVLTAEELMAAARQWCTAQRIVVGHANHATVTTVYGELLALIAERGLRTVTLADVWATPAQRLRGSVAAGRARTS
ncbi:polysaccharide deacetylase family protein [Blastococcus tunisiensis]|uniref:Peptidoglycan/xylan/chitin deacetylase, PgdA/CDA1 family n=1 Tax=Blastococcus tunisiensis TaxID=1798228 RepID=A0A1I2EGU7_9ACTN|nr:polysaccharide deacetylase family protein [Blastococcus sp. DSM 46838]SFE91867.1 Peptidoglycan/xylan/chitin deacetylase, PgdA/CDA1 family [Blastococcus sp. DSM 46838]